ncbi:MAG: aminopeptidase P family protein [Synergistetes bacterium]|nr:aminopeptidase P family protein [Synergistota bacterium]
MKEVKNRINRLRSFLAEKEVDFALILDPLNQYYYTGFYAIIYSRPILLTISQNETHLIVPCLEELHAKEDATVDKIHVYYEHPEKAHAGTQPFSILKEIIIQKGWKGAGVEKEKLPTSIAEFLAEIGVRKIQDVGNFIRRERLKKDEEELNLIRKAGKLVSLGVRESLKAIKENITEIEIDAIGHLAILKMAAESFAGSRVDLFAMSPSGIERSILPHVFSIARKLKRGDIVIHSRQVALNGYRSECERTVFLGNPSQKQKSCFQIMLEAQKAAMEKVKAGVRCKEIDEAARKIISKAGFGEFAIHRTGHGLGLSVHEGPYLRFDSEDILEEGMVLSIEPGFYIPGIGGFRHSDTVIVKENGYELITSAPSSLEECILEP